MSQNNRVRSLAGVLAWLVVTGVLITIFAGIWFHWIVILAAMYFNIKSCAAIGRDDED